MKTLNELCRFEPKRMIRIEQALVEDRKSSMPWYLRLIVGIGAWLASLFFLIFAVILVGWEDVHHLTIGIMGVTLLITAVAIGRQKWGIFAGQCALAVSLAGQAMIYYGFPPESHPLGGATLLCTGLAILLYAIYPNFLSRLLTCFFALQITLLWLHQVGQGGDLLSGSYRVRPEIANVLILYWGLHLVAICACFLWTRHSVLLAPLGYALVASLAAWQIGGLCNLWVHAYEVTYTPAWVGWIFYHFQLMLTAALVLGVTVWASGGLRVARAQPGIFIGVALALAALVWLGAGGVLLAVLFLLLGFSLQNTPVLGLGLVLLPVFVSNYYYHLRLDLLAKAGMLVGSGVVLLALRAGLRSWTPAGSKEEA